MRDKKLLPPMTRRLFANSWSELDYLCKKIDYWLYAREQRTRAERYRDRLERVLNELPENNRAILREEGLALLYELQGRISKAIAHRKREIRLMERLHQEAGSPQYADSTRAYMLRDRDTKALEHRRVILETLQKAKARQRDEVLRSPQ